MIEDSSEYNGMICDDISEKDLMIVGSRTSSDFSFMNFTRLNSDFSISLGERLDSDISFKILISENIGSSSNLIGVPHHESDISIISLPMKVSDKHLSFLASEAWNQKQKELLQYMEARKQNNDNSKLPSPVGEVSPVYNQGDILAYSSPTNSSSNLNNNNNDQYIRIYPSQYLSSKSHNNSSLNQLHKIYNTNMTKPMSTTRLTTIAIPTTTTTTTTSTSNLNHPVSPNSSSYINYTTTSTSNSNSSSSGNNTCGSSATNISYHRSLQLQSYVIQHLMTSYETIQKQHITNFMNAIKLGDRLSLIKCIEECCTESCTLLTPDLIEHPPINKSTIILYFSLLFECYPDGLYRILNDNVIHNENGILSMSYTFSGTHLYDKSFTDMYMEIQENWNNQTLSNNTPFTYNTYGSHETINPTNSTIMKGSMNMPPNNGISSPNTIDPYSHMTSSKCDPSYNLLTDSDKNRIQLTSLSPSLSLNQTNHAYTTPNLQIPSSTTSQNSSSSSSKDYVHPTQLNMTLSSDTTMNNIYINPNTPVFPMNMSSKNYTTGFNSNMNTSATNTTNLTSASANTSNLNNTLSIFTKISHSLDKMFSSNIMSLKSSRNTSLTSSSATSSSSSSLSSRLSSSYKDKNIKYKRKIEFIFTPFLSSPSTLMSTPNMTNATSNGIQNPPKIIKIIITNIK